MKYLKLFKTTGDRNNFIISTKEIIPNVHFTRGIKGIDS